MKFCERIYVPIRPFHAGEGGWAQLESVPGTVLPEQEDSAGIVEYNQRKALQPALEIVRSRWLRGLAKFLAWRLVHLIEAISSNTDLVTFDAQH